MGEFGVPRLKHRLLASIRIPTNAPWRQEAGGRSGEKPQTEGAAACPSRAAHGAAARVALGAGGGLVEALLEWASALHQTPGPGPGARGLIL